MTENPHEQSRDLDQEGPGDLPYKEAREFDEQGRPTDLPYKDDTSDGTTAAKTPQELAEETAHLVKSSDDRAREAEGREHPTEGHDVRDYRPVDTEPANVPDNPGYQAPENVGDDDAVDEHGDDVDTPDDGAR